MNVDTEEQELGQAERRRKLVKKRLESLMQSNPQLYYEATPVVARAVYEDFQSEENVSGLDQLAIAELSVRDIEIILAFR